MKEKFQKNKKTLIWSAVIATAMHVAPMAYLAGQDVELSNSFIGLSIASAVFVFWGRYKMIRI